MLAVGSSKFLNQQYVILGAVIVGTVDGSRIWGKELKKLGLMDVQWSPDSKHILFALRNGEFHLYSDEGVFTVIYF